MRYRSLAAAVAVIAATGGAVAILEQPDDRPETSVRPAATAASPSSAVPSSPRASVRVIGTPDHVRIDAIDVDAGVIGVGTAADNSQEVPASLTEAGWWQDGRRPGQSGNAVVVGHTASRDDGVFDRLGDVARGDVVTISDGSDDVEFRVTAIDDVRVEEFASVADDVYRTSGPRGLVLMTCGDWNGTAFESTIIVRATAA